MEVNDDSCGLGNTLTIELWLRCSSLSNLQVIAGIVKRMSKNATSRTSALDEITFNSDGGNILVMVVSEGEYSLIIEIA